MGADNWAICPRCSERAQQENAAEHERVMGLYGRVDVDEFDRQRSELREVDWDSINTFRESYEFYGASEGTVEYVYSGGCTRCGLAVKLDGQKQFWPEDG